ncbi:uncharacterized protein BXIN_2261 [Babesia sp. Xinjiang]|uniref:uncharacterized protein n=1 Tax=Babesia sp. Xinjiang TaxID=462227 RepID=UPI000A237197|nr:uncharacterized protein BXIN_2261 [Babesia sp. Xinjiang]ORM40808.1 hypothetical protein BXIN_2261 [Babesia sp. Xinjiang]
MAAIAQQGYKVKGINNVVIKLYPQVLGIHKVHEHNLCNALRDFGLMLKADCRTELLQYNYDFLKFAHTMRSSELCMIAHGYSMLNLEDRNWWDQFTAVASKNSFDMDGKEMAGLLYSLSKVYTGKHPLIARLIEESTHWIQHATASTLSLLVKVISNLKIGDSYLHRINARAIEIVDQLNMVDVIFFVTSNTEAKTHNPELYRMLCLRAIKLYDDMELHHLRALAACLSIAGYKSTLFYNILAIRLVEICRNKSLRDGDVISLFLAYTSQKFLTQNDLCIDVNVYKQFLKQRFGSVTKDKFEFPVAELAPVLAKALEENIDRITYNGMPIVLRAISILRLPVDKNLYERVICETALYISENKYDDLKLSNLVVTLAKRQGRHDVFWNAVHELLSKPGMKINADLLAKMTVTLSNHTNDECRRRVYEDLLQLSSEHCKYMSVKSIFALTRVLVANMEVDVLCSTPYVDAIIALVGQLRLSDVFNLFKLYPFRLLPTDDGNLARMITAARAALEKAGDDNSCYAPMKRLIDGVPGYKQE